MKKNDVNLVERWASVPSMNSAIQSLLQLRQELTQRAPTAAEQDVADCISSALDLIEVGLANAPTGFGDILANELSSVQTALG
jgi:hypothetical protein